jgi:hypothetical protein
MPVVIIITIIITAKLCVIREETRPQRRVFCVQGLCAISVCAVNPDRIY